MFTPLRNWLQTFVDRRFKPVAPANTGPMEDASPTIDQRVAMLEQRIARVEISGRQIDDGTDW